MSAHFIEPIPFAVLGASLLGSGHCVAMCGGLVMTVARNRKAVFLYHFGRLIGYCSLGAVAGLVGKTTLGSDSMGWISWFSTSVLTVSFIFLGVRLWFGRPLHLFRLPPRLWQKMAQFGPGTTGLLSALLPCGWLHAFILGALATRSPIRGSVYLLFFWLGTLPALSIAPLTARRIFEPLARRAPRISAIILIAIGIVSLGMKMMPDRSQLGCHCRGNSQGTKI